ncbi:Predicted ATP-binding protein involved in virulence [Chryseolinea serpens]|uniref:Predicted ATP-binding protein involved in virulence n=1 Tax=Chryseolinea serpens TaxID=947013 RepID=A0A1M5UKU8_9BACT|nr:AAA family ATPase [Chryseolinea serpens]SHH63609.1 Predicted ATP-binding protein involved in virulence [Chryseolinea serpens]
MVNLVGWIRGLEYLSGAKSMILKELPREERKKYRLLGFYNIVGGAWSAFLLTIAFVVQTEYELSYDRLFLAVPICLLIHYLIVRQLISSWRVMTRLIFWAMALAPIGFFIFSVNNFSIRSRSAFVDEEAGKKLDSLAVIKRHVELTLDKLDYEKEYYVQRYGIDTTHYRYESDRLPQRYLKVLDEIDSLKFVLAYTNEKERMVAKTDSQSFEYVGYSRSFRWSDFLMSLAFAIPLCVLYVFEYLKLSASRTDVYHTLLMEFDRMEMESMLDEQQRVVEDFRLRSEIRKTTTVYKEIKESITGDDVSHVNEILTNLGGETSSAIMTLAEIELGRMNYEKALATINRAIGREETQSGQNKEYLPEPRFYELKARIQYAMSDFDAAKVTSERYVALNNERKYRDNLTREILLERLEVEGLPFYGSFRWDFQPGINILLGKNGYGKSHLMGLIVSLLYDDKTRIREWIPDSAIHARAKLYVDSNHPVNDNLVAGLINEITALIQNKENLESNLRNSKNIVSDKGSPELERVNELLNEKMEKIDSEQRRILGNYETIVGNIGRVPILAIPDSRFIDKSESEIYNGKKASEDLKRDGATEFLYGRPFSEIIKKGLFVVAQKNSTDFTKEPYNLIERVISNLADNQLSTDATNEISKSSRFFKFKRIETINATGDYKFYVESEGSNDEFLLQKISQGTFSVLAICLVIYRFLSELKPDSQNVLHEKAIVLIDEIDAHLHPSWEQRIIGILRREFPNVQFIITAHSPLVVAGCYEREVAVIRQKDDKNGFWLRQFDENFIGVTASELLKRAFGIEDRDDQYLAYSALEAEESEIRAKVKKLETRRDLIPTEQMEMDKLNKDLVYIDVVKSVRVKNADASIQETKLSALQAENEFLKRKLTSVEIQTEANQKPAQ